MSKNNHTADIVICGGGLAGLTLACFCGQAGMRTTVIDFADPNKPMKGDERTTAISYGSEKILDEAGIWQYLEDQRCPIRDIQILDGASSVLLNFLSDEVEGKDFGNIIENTRIRQALHTTLKSYENVEMVAPAKVVNFEHDDDLAHVILDNGDTISAQLIVGADGRNSFMRDWLDIDCRHWDYKQTAVICIVQHENPHDHVAVEHFFPEGPFAVLPMIDDHNGNHRSSVVFTEHGRKEDSLAHFSKEDFERALQARFPESYGMVKMIGERTSYSLSLVHASRYIDNRMVLIADAAHGIHPIAGQGLNLGFRDVKELAKLVTTRFQNNDDIGAEDLLKQYQRRRRIDNMAMVAVTDGLVRLFSNNLPPLRLARAVGLKTVSRIPFMKRFFMRQAMADRG